MINFFRKARKKLADDNKLFKYSRYAIGEIILVVIGILIALSINNWKAYTKDRIREKTILSNIKENLLINDALINDYIEYHLNNNKSSQIIIKSISNKLPYNDSLDTHFNRSRFQIVGSNYLSHMGYEELKNAGFDIISNKNLKNEILNLFEVIYASKINRLSWFDQIDPLREKNYYDNFIDSEGALTPINYNLLLTDTYYLSTITALNIHRKYWVKMLSECKEESQRVLQLINNELEKQNEL